MEHVWIHVKLNQGNSRKVGDCNRIGLIINRATIKNTKKKKRRETPQEVCYAELVILIHTFLSPNLLLLPVPFTETMWKQSIALTLMMRDFGECVGVGGWLFTSKKKNWFIAIIIFSWFSFWSPSFLGQKGWLHVLSFPLKTSHPQAMYSQLPSPHLLCWLLLATTLQQI